MSNADLSTVLSEIKRLMQTTEQLEKRVSGLENQMQQVLLAVTQEKNDFPKQYTQSTEPQAESGERNNAS